MQIKNPKFKEGQKVRNIEDGTIFTIKNINCYGFDDCEYWYNLECDGLTLARPESILELYQEPPKTVWDLKEGDTYYLIFGDGKVTETTWGCCDKKFREIGNTFLTKAEAEFERERRKIEAEMLRLGGRRVFKKGENNYYIVCDFDSHYDIWISNKSDGFARMMIYFDSNKECGNAIETIGEYRIKRYIFGVES